MQICFNKNILSNATAIHLHNFEFYTASSYRYILLYMYLNSIVYTAVNTFNRDSMEKSLGVSLSGSRNFI